jgi:murein L,D-transpeptidase YafK
MLPIFGSHLASVRIIHLFCAMIILPMHAFASCPPSGPRVNKALARQRHRLRILLANKKISWGAPIYLRIFKSEKRLEVWLLKGERFCLFKSYPICTYGTKGLGPKTRQGDGYAPEGFYAVHPKQMNPYSQFYLAFNVGYPNAYDRYHGRTGSALMVHGHCVSIGCFAMTDAAIEEIYLLAHSALAHGQSFFPVHVFPFEMTAANMKRHRHSSWFGFWNNLKQGYDRFILDGHVPPEATVRNGRYHFKPGCLPNSIRHDAADRPDD